MKRSLRWTVCRWIAGERRIRAFLSLNRQSIPARVVDVPSLAEGEYAENEVRKDFTPSERVAMGLAVEEELGKRQGERTDRLKDHGPEVRKGQTRDLAAERVGFGKRGGKSYERAKHAVRHGIPEVVEMMDREDLD